MALKPCRACSKEVNDQTEFCPNCGINGPVENLVTSLPPPQDGEDDIVSPRTARMTILAFVLLIIGVSMLSNEGGGLGVFFVASSLALTVLSQTSRVDD
jgi:hypothetical protein